MTAPRPEEKSWPSLPDDEHSPGSLDSRIELEVGGIMLLDPAQQRCRKVDLLRPACVEMQDGRKIEPPAELDRKAMVGVEGEEAVDRDRSVTVCDAVDLGTQMDRLPAIGLGAPEPIEEVAEIRRRMETMRVVARRGHELGAALVDEPE